MSQNEFDFSSLQQYYNIDKPAWFCVYISIESPPVIFILKKRYHNRNFRTEFLSGKLPRP